MFGSPLALVLAYRKISLPDDKSGELFGMLCGPLLWNIMIVKLVLLRMLILWKILNTFRYVHILCVCVCVCVCVCMCVCVGVCTHAHMNACPNTQTYACVFKQYLLFAGATYFIFYLSAVRLSVCKDTAEIMN